MDDELRVAGNVTARDRDVHRAGLGWVGEEFVEVHAGSMADGRAETASEKRRHLVGMDALHQTDEIHAAMEAHELAPSNPPLYLPIRHSKPQQLAARDHSVLGAGQLRDFSANRVQSTHTVDKTRLTPNSPPCDFWRRAGFTM